MRIILTLALSLLFAHAALAETFTAKVIGIQDGDTITVLRDRSQARVRLQGIDTPERRQPFGTKAKAFTSSLAFGKHVEIHVSEKDQYGRLLGIVILPDGTNLNHALVGNGFAWWYRTYARNDRTLQALEAQARAERRGLWADSNPVPPWEWRRLPRP